MKLRHAGRARVMIHDWAKPPKKLPPARILLFRYGMMAIGLDLDVCCLWRTCV
jgi:hypothetical protein